jgi:hypothetical protein
MYGEGGREDQRSLSYIYNGGKKGEVRNRERKNRGWNVAMIGSRIRLKHPRNLGHTNKRGLNERNATRVRQEATSGLVFGLKKAVKHGILELVCV